MNIQLAGTTLAITLLAGAASAATFDFTTVGFGSVGSDTLVLDEGTFESAGGSLFIGAGNLPNSICATGPSCAHDMNLDFNGLASNITLTIGGAQEGDSVDIQLFDAMGTLLETQTATVNGVLSFASTGVASIFFDDNSTAAGVVYGNWSFDLVPNVSEVPLPAAGLLLLAGLGGLGAASRRKSKQ